jgi:molecular chaperone GrpE
MSDESRNGRPDNAQEKPREPAENQQKPQGKEPQSQSGPEALAAENADLRDRLLRAMAEMENLRRRTEREKSDTARYAISNFARDVLTVGDNLRRTVEHVPAEAAAADPALKSFLDGVELTERELLKVLERHGVSKLDPIGQRFDPNCHQAMYEVPNADVPEGTVVEVMQAGYAIGDRCLRPALVAVSKGGAKPSGEPGTPTSGQAANDDSPGGRPGGGEGGNGPRAEGVGGKLDHSA